MPLVVFQMGIASFAKWVDARVVAVVDDEQVQRPERTSRADCP